MGGLSYKRVLYQALDCSHRSDSAPAGAAALPPAPRRRLPLLVLLAATRLCGACTDGPCGPGNEMCRAPGPGGPALHVSDLTCYENDPNFPFFDPLHELYHLFYQDHLAEPQGGVGQGPVIGHVVSADLVHWARLPVALWNDQPYDRVAIYTGSATLVDGVPTLVYPGLCDSALWKGGCDTGTVAAIAVPANHSSDPLLVNWTKLGVVMNNTQRDPTTAWQTASGEWRFTNFEGKVFSSIDNFRTWSTAGDGSAIFPSAECPDFFPLPPRCHGNGCDAPWPGPTPPTHVHKISGNWPVATDRYSFGVYLDGEQNSTGTWTPTAGVPQLQAMDATTLLNISRKFYASKSFFDPVDSRRIFWGWLVSCGQT